MRTTVAVALVLSVGLLGCMTMTRGRAQTIEIRTSPPGARVEILPVASDLVSPAQVSLTRKPDSTVNVSAPSYKGTSYLVTVSRPGYKDASVPVDSRFTGRTWAQNLIWLNPMLIGVGVLIDVGTGAAYELTPSSIFLKLEPATKSVADRR
jgi:hypothetical protein